MEDVTPHFKILGRDPLLILALVATGVQLAATLGLDNLSATQASLWVTAVYAVFGAVNALFVRPITPEVFTYAAGALAALGAGYGLEFTAEQTGYVAGGVVILISLVTREKISPIETSLTNR